MNFKEILGFFINKNYTLETYDSVEILDFLDNNHRASDFYEIQITGYCSLDKYFDSLWFCILQRSLVWNFDNEHTLDYTKRILVHTEDNYYNFLISSDVDFVVIIYDLSWVFFINCFLNDSHSVTIPFRSWFYFSVFGNYFYSVFDKNLTSFDNSFFHLDVEINITVCRHLKIELVEDQQNQPKRDIHLNFVSYFYFLIQVYHEGIEYLCSDFF